VSLIGSSVVAYAVVWHVALTTHDVVGFTVVAFAAMVPQGLMSLVGGVWADRFSRKALVIGADAVVALVTVALAVAVLSGNESLWLLTGALVLRGIGGGVQVPAVAAILPSITPAKHLLRVNSVFGSVQAAVLLVVPAVAAVLLVVWDMGWILFVDVATAAVAIAILAVLTVPPTAQAPAVLPDTAPAADEPAGLGTATAAGQAHAPGAAGGMGPAWRFVLSHPGLRRTGWLVLVMTGLVMPGAMLAPVVVVRLYGDSTVLLAAVEIGYAGAFIVGGLILAAWGGMKNRMTMMLVVTAAWAGFTVMQGVVPWALVYVALWIPWGLVGPGLVTVSTTVMQQETPAHLLGRVMGLLQVVMLLVTPVVLLAVAPLVAVVEPRAFLVVSGVAGLVATAVLARRAPPLFAPDELSTGGPAAGAG